MEEDIGSRLSRYPPDCSEVMVGVGGSVSVKRGRVYQREGGFYLFLFVVIFQNIDDQHQSVLFYMRGVTIKLLLEFTYMGEKRYVG